MDRDGTISEEVGYINHVSRFRPFAYSTQAVRLLNDSQWLAVLVTNQAGVARGYFTESLISSVHEVLKSELASGGARLDGIYYCAHHPSVGESPYRLDCNCRKPKPGLIERAVNELNLDVASCWMVGDRYSDIQLARNAGVKSAFVFSGYGRGEWEHQRESWQHQPDLVAENLLEAVSQIISNEGS